MTATNAARPMTPSDLAALRQRIEHRALLVRALLQAGARRFTGEPIADFWTFAASGQIVSSPCC